MTLRHILTLPSQVLPDMLALECIGRGCNSAEVGDR